MESLERTPLLDSAIEALRKALLNGQFNPGDRIEEIAVANQLGISRSTMREAMRQLEQEGLLTRIPFRGTFARELTQKEVEELNSIRGVLETYAAELIIKHATDEEIAGLNEIVAKIEQTDPEENPEIALDLHFAFHKTLCRLSNHELLCSIWTNLSQQIMVALRLSQLAFIARGEGATLAQAHRDIVEAIAARDVELAKLTIREHVSISGMEN